jgi:uncharacterized membrane protein YGL010W
MSSSFHDYMRAYANDHTHPVNRALHLVGIPLIVASLPVIPVSPPVGLGMFAAGWALQFTGHVFEQKKPSFSRDLRFLAVGPVWITVEWVEILTGVTMYTPPAQTSSETNGAAATAQA